MRNRYAGKCYRCGAVVAPGDGHFERFNGGWRTQHASCAIAFRGKTDPERASVVRSVMESRASGTGKKAQQARKWPREHT